ncbi:hypothetical protein [Mycolicibacterium mengxianglii]|uniref:hypothetical protein n=1 Tax=Mycolicibacterium mengxianglii TaxID=2736649 RepID=UPI0018D04EE4|nr:hypothetical protein [Mycolicibacterium mengxianglii]
MTTNENVVFRNHSDQQPGITYRSLPSHCAGAADTIAEARASYRNELTSRLNLDRHELPRVIEHVEAKVAGIWVRSKVGAVHRDRLSDRMFLQRVLSAGDVQDEVRAHLGAATERGAEPVIVLAEPEDPVGTVLDQMTPDDALVVTFPDERRGLAWAAIHGPHSAGFDELPVARFDTGIRELPIESFAESCIAEHRLRAVRVEPYVLARAS